MGSVGVTGWSSTWSVPVPKERRTRWCVRNRPESGLLFSPKDVVENGAHFWAEPAAGQDHDRARPPRRDISTAPESPYRSVSTLIGCDPCETRKRVCRNLADWRSARLTNYSRAGALGHRARLARSVRLQEPGLSFQATLSMVSGSLVTPPPQSQGTFFRRVMMCRRSRRLDSGISPSRRR